VGQFSPQALAGELAGEATMLFAVPTMYRDLADAAESDPAVASALAGGRLLASGSAPLPPRDWTRIERATRQRIVQRCGLTETLMNCAVPASRDRRPGTVGPPLPGVEVGLIGGSGAAMEGDDVVGESATGEVVVRGPNVFLGYLNDPRATANALRDGWFHTGDVAAARPGGMVPDPGAEGPGPHQDRRAPGGSRRGGGRAAGAPGRG
jgi:malonyl-CoA/methylmalonyl-CoA synthetase